MKHGSVKTSKRKSKWNDAISHSPTEDLPRAKWLAVEWKVSAVARFQVVLVACCWCDEASSLQISMKVVWFILNIWHHCSLSYVSRTMHSHQLLLIFMG